MLRSWLTRVVIRLLVDRNPCGIARDGLAVIRSKRVSTLGNLLSKLIAFSK